MRENTLLALVTILAPLSVASIGGASSVYAPLQYQTVDVHHWLTGHEFVDLFAIARVTPGPGTMMATLIGWKVAGLAGAFDDRIGHDVEAALDIAELLLVEWRTATGRAEPDLAPEPDHRDIMLVLAELRIELCAEGPLVGSLAERSL